MDKEQSFRPFPGALTVPDPALIRKNPASSESGVENPRGRRYDSQTSTAVNSRANSADRSISPTDPGKDLSLPGVEQAKDQTPYHVMSKKRKSMYVSGRYL